MSNASHGDPQEPPVPPTPPQPVDPSAAPAAADGPTSFSGPAWFAPPAPPQGTLPGAAADASPAAVTRSAPRRVRRRLALGLAAAVLVLALVAGVLTGGFGLLRSGAGAATPQEEAVKVAEETVGLFNSFSLKDLLNNPLSAIHNVTEEIAPSEARLEPTFTTVDTSDLFALTSDSLLLSADLVGSFSVSVSGLQTEVTQITDDLAVVTYSAGELTMTADVDRLTAALDRLPAVVADQLEVTLATYGLTPSKPVDLGLSADWDAELLADLETRFPYRVDMADCTAIAKGEQIESDPTLQGICGYIGRVVVVKEEGRWYLSPLLTWSSEIGATGDLSDDGDLVDPARKELLAIPAAQHSDPTEAPGGLIAALVAGDQEASLAELPLAERRYAAVAGLLAEPSLTGFQSSSEFSELRREGDQAKLRIEQLTLTSDFASIEVTDGSCVRFDDNAYCLRDLKNESTISLFFDMLAAMDWTAFEQATGVSADTVISKLHGGAQAALAAIDPDQVGLVAVREDDTWLFSATASLGELQNQLLVAIRAGLMSMQE